MARSVTRDNSITFAKLPGSWNALNFAAVGWLQGAVARTSGRYFLNYFRPARVGRYGPEAIEDTINSTVLNQ
jgi:hypothetical protein